MKRIVFWVFVTGAIFLGAYVKSWQCAEMFPNADRMACILWK